MKLYIVVNEWDIGTENGDITLREERFYTLDKAAAQAELDSLAAQFGVDLPHDQTSFEDVESLNNNDYYYIQEAELDG